MLIQEKDSTENNDWVSGLQMSFNCLLSFFIDKIDKNCSTAAESLDHGLGKLLGAFLLLLFHSFLS